MTENVERSESNIEINSGLNSDIGKCEVKPINKINNDLQSNSVTLDMHRMDNKLKLRKLGLFGIIFGDSDNTSVYIAGVVSIGFFLYGSILSMGIMHSEQYEFAQIMEIWKTLSVFIISPLTYIFGRKQPD